MIDQKFGYLTVLERDSNNEKSGTYFKVKCDCGVYKSVRKDGLIRGTTKSCGCKKSEITATKKRIPIILEFFSKPSPELSYFLGFFLADGYLPSKGFYIGLQLQEKDREILEKFSLLIFGYSRLQYIKKSKKDAKNRQDQYRLLFSSPVVKKYLEELGFDSNKSESATVPSMFAYDWNFWRGMLDGDGTICYTNGNLLISLTGAPEVINSFSLFCNSLGFNKNQRTPLSLVRYKIPLSEFRLSGKEALQFLNTMYSDITQLHLQRKFKKFLDIKTKM